MLDLSVVARYNVLDSLPRAGYLIWENTTLATKDKKTAKKPVSDMKITRIRATSDTPEKKAKTTAKKVTQPKKEGRSRTNPLRSIGGYFAGAWYELKQVRWPNRKATWGLTAAVLGFTAFFVVLILLLDALFKYLFQLILG